MPTNDSRLANQKKKKQNKPKQKRQTNVRAGAGRPKCHRSKPSDLGSKLGKLGLAPPTSSTRACFDAPKRDNVSNVKNGEKMCKQTL